MHEKSRTRQNFGQLRNWSGQVTLFKVTCPGQVAEKNICTALQIIAGPWAVIRYFELDMAADQG